MPWEVKSRGPKKWVVVKKGTTQVVGTHDSKAKADAQLRALYANTKE